MAEAPSLYAESLEKLDQELTCPICLKHFEEPKVLPCCHYYCRECIVQMQARTRGKDYFQCPECRKETRLPGNDPDSLLTAFFVNRMKELFSMMQKAQGKVELTCESCRRGTTPVEAFCRHCALFICQSCEEAHCTMRPFSDHVVVPLDDLRQNTAAHFPVKEEAQMKCKEHSGKKMKLYCYDCKQLICKDCIIKDHKEHEYEFINKAAVQYRESLKESVVPLRKIQASLSQAVVETEKAASAVSQSGVDIAAAIDQKFDALIASVQKRREELHREARKTIEEKQKNLTVQRKNIQQATVEVQSMIEFVDHKSQQANDQELLGLQKQIHDRVNEVAQKYSNPAKQFKPAEVRHLELKCTSRSAIEGITLGCQGTPPSLPPTSDSPHMFSNFSPEVLALLAKIPEGDLPGVQYHPKEGTVDIESRSKEELEDRISRFQTAYQGILGARKLMVEPVEVPPALDDEIAEQITASFNKQYNQCVFIYYADPRVMKVVSTSSRQFDQAKKLLVEALASRPDPSIGTKVEFSRKEEVIVLPGGRKLTLKKANIVEEEVNVIVNATNSRLLHGGGVARAINDASHGSVQKYSNAYVMQKGEVPVGQVAVTHAGGALKCKHVVHAVGPQKSHSYGECEHLLTQVINSTLSRVEKANSTSIAIPAISSGIFGVNSELVARCVVDAILNFHFTKAPPVLSDIRIVIIDKPTYSCFARYFVQKRALPKQAPRKPFEPHESQSAGIGQWGHPNTSAAPVSGPPPLEQNPPHPPTSVSADIPQELVDLKSEGNPKTEPDVSPRVLTPDDLSMLNMHLCGVSRKWYSLGFHLGFTTDQLENLVSTVDANCDPAVYLSKVLFTWLQRANPPTLEELCRALSHERIGEKELALQLLHFCRVQTTGTKGSELMDANAISNTPTSVPVKAERKLAANFNKKTSAVLTLDDLSALNKYLHSVSPKWYPLGLQLGFTTETLANLVPVNCDPAVCLSKVLAAWLQRAHPPTLEALCRALSHVTIGEQRLAEWLLHQYDLAKREESTTANTISYPALPLDQSGERNGSSTTLYSNEPPPSSSHPSGYGQPLTEARGARMTGMPNTSAGSTPIHVPVTVTHTQSSHVPPGTDPLSSPGRGGQPAFTRSMSDPASSTWGVFSTATSGTVTYSQAAAAGGGGVTASTFDPNMTAITKQPHKEDKHRGGSGGGNKGRGSHGQHHNKGGHKSKSFSATGATEEDKICPICLDEFTNPTRTKCGHQFCSGCLEKALKYDPFCPTCKQALRPIIGKQPQGGQMTHRILYAQSLSGYQGYNTIQIDYSIPGGVQGPEHPNPGRRFSGTSRTAYLPGNYEGREALQLLKKAFDARLIFTVGTSVTSGAQNTVVWNDIHHKTSMYGGAYGYPDATYLQRVKEDLAAKGIVPDSSAV